MTRLAFYAPLKPPTHANPSGDRLIARLLMKALTQAGFDVTLAARFRSREGKGNPHRQQRLITMGEQWAKRLIRHWDKRGYRPQVWFTYHLYYKAPDLIGPYVAHHYQIPYIVSEASWAGKRAGGQWALFHQRLETALLQAQRIFTLNQADSAALRRFLPADKTDVLVTLPAFIDCHTIKPAKDLPVPVDQRCKHHLITVAMMRPGDKLASYRLLAEALPFVTDADFQWFMVGDGAAAEEIRALFKDDPRICCTGRLAPAQIQALLAHCQLHVWPAVNEAFGMTVLEAQAQGVAILSGNEGGVRYVMANGVSGELVTPRDPQALGKALQRLLNDSARLQRYRQQARAYVRAHHDLPQAAARLHREITTVLQGF